MRRALAALLLTGLLAGLLAGCDPRAGAAPPGGAASPVAGFPSAMAALGDSLTVAFNACLFPGECARDSWSTGDGTQVSSHYKRIVAANRAMAGHARNLAVPGSVAADLAGQAASAVRLRASYVTVLVGANDACRPTVADMTDPAAYRAAVDRALGVLKQGLPQARLLVVSIPDVYRLWQLEHTNRTAVRVWAHGYCPSLLANATSTADADTARRLAVRDRIDAYDRELAGACAAYGPHCRYDGGAVHAVAFGTGLLAPDYFHPNAAGQNELARVTYPGRFTW
jgi:lysophospholipase L1-like esterase